MRNYGRLVVKELVTHRMDADLAVGYGLAVAGAVAAARACWGRGRGRPGMRMR